MKISVNWLKEYTDIDISVDELVQKIGAQLGAVEEVVDLSKKYQGIVVAKVVECAKHPDADKLHVCKIDDGGTTKNVERDENGLVQVVCGAPNVREGLLVAWLPPGAVVPSTFGKEEFKLEARKLRGVVSNGMLASPAELDISNDHDGLLEIETGKPGDSFAHAFGLDDVIIDIENKMFTHRPDCFGILGVAREVAGIQHKKFTSPDWYLDTPDFEEGSGLELQVTNEVADLTPRFMAVAIKDVEIKPSPIKLQSYLTKVGIKPINNIVDVTNYMMYLTGQPMHAYDYDKVKALGNRPDLIVRKGKVGEELKVLGGKTIKLREEDIVIAADKQVIGLGGVIGGAETEVDSSTENIILECANFDMYTIRRTSMAHGLFTDAVTRFTKGQSPLQNDRVLAKAIEGINEVSGGVQASKVIDKDNASKKVHDAVSIHVDFVQSRLGLAQMQQDEVATYLRNVEFLVSNDDGLLSIVSPFWRTDIEIKEDVVEEIGRLYGYDHVPLESPVRPMTPVALDNDLSAKQSIRHHLAQLGANEVLTYSFVNGKLFKRANQDEAEAYQISNALSPDLQHYRLSLTPSLLSLVHPNIKAGHDEFALFEIGKVHGKSQTKDGLPEELGRVGLVYANKQDVGPAPFYQVKMFASELLGKFGLDLKFVALRDSGISGHKMFEQLTAPYDPSRTAAVFHQEKLLGIVGEFSSDTVSAFKLPTNSAGLELFMSAFTGANQPEYQPLSRFPSIEQDLCLKVTADLPYQTLLDNVNETIQKASPDDVVVSVSPVDIYQSKEDKDHKQITIRLNLVSYERTLTNEVATHLNQVVADGAKTSFGATKI